MNFITMFTAFIILLCSLWTLGKAIETKQDLVLNTVIGSVCILSFIILLMAVYQGFTGTSV